MKTVLSASPAYLDGLPVSICLGRHDLSARRYSTHFLSQRKSLAAPSPMLSASPPVTGHDSRVAIRCIISLREHPPERSRMPGLGFPRSEEHTSELQSPCN